MNWVATFPNVLLKRKVKMELESRQYNLLPEYPKQDDCLKSGQFLALIRVVVQLKDDGIDHHKMIMEREIHQYLSVLPRGTKVVEVEELPMTELCFSYKVKFFHPFLNRVSFVDLDYVKCYEIVDGVLTPFNLFKSIHYFDHNRKLIFE